MKIHALLLRQFSKPAKPFTKPAYVNNVLMERIAMHLFFKLSVKHIYGIGSSVKTRLGGYSKLFRHDIKYCLSLSLLFYQMLYRLILSMHE